MRNIKTIVYSLLALLSLVPGSGYLLAQSAPEPSSTHAPVESDTALIEAIVHGNPSDHFAEDGSFTNIFGTVRSGEKNSSNGTSRLLKRFLKVRQSRIPSRSFGSFVPMSPL
jgi:hypothetical protein